MSEIKINSQGEVKLFDSDNSNYIGLKAPGTVSSDQTFILPDADGSANNALKTDGSGNLGFVDVTTLVTQGIDWQSTLKTGDFTAVSGEGYFINTTSGAITATLPASPSAGNIVAFKDYAATFATNNLTVGRNSSNIQGSANNSVLSTNRASVVLVYVDATKGWLYVQESNVQNLGPLYVTASGGTETTSGDFKIHTFTSSGTFTVSDAGNANGSNTVDYLVVAGGASGGSSGGGGGAGGFRESFPNPATGGLSVSAQGYPITVGAGGAGAPSGSRGAVGSNSIFSSVTSAGGGEGGSNASGAGGNGGSGGGAGAPSSSGGTGNTPPVSPSQGNNGSPETDPLSISGAGGGGATSTGNDSPSRNGGPGGNGGGTSINPAAGTPGPSGPLRYFSGGGAGGGGSAGGGGTGGYGGGANGGGEGPGTSGSAGTANTGGGGGGGGLTAGGVKNPSGAGGSGVVIIRYKYQN